MPLVLPKYCWVDVVRTANFNKFLLETMFGKLSYAIGTDDMPWAMLKSVWKTRRRLRIPNLNEKIFLKNIEYMKKWRNIPVGIDINHMFWKNKWAFEAMIKEVFFLFKVIFSGLVTILCHKIYKSGMMIKLLL